MKRMLERSADTLHRAHAAGVPMVLGTDSGFSLTPYGVWHARELDLLMTYAGLTSLEAIQAGTANGARMLGLDGRIGTVAPGMIADLIVVNGDPVADITVLQRRDAIETVVSGGAVVEFDEEAIARSWPHERGIGYSVTDLTYDVVHGADPRDLPPGDPFDFEPEQAQDLVSDMRRRERSAGTF
jgi:cytosine/adenosine deaminase-related metal-dependent hydrolase